MALFEDLSGFALQIKYPQERLEVAHSNCQEMYETFRIPKKTGGVRTIHAPNIELKPLQQAIDDWIRIQHKVSRGAHGYVRNRSIVTNARSHVGKAHVLNIDLKDFFPTIGERFVSKLFRQHPFNLPRRMSDYVAHLCCYQGKLPQGAPTSPVISNMACKKLDERLADIAKESGLVYTRYADDITLSCGEDEFPTAIAFEKGGQWQLGRQLLDAITSSGFEINMRKVRMQPNNRRQVVTGIVVNRRLNLPREYFADVRAMLHSRQQAGPDLSLARYQSLNPSSSAQNIDEILRGKIEFIAAVRGSNDPIYLKFLNQFMGIVGTSP